MFRLSKHIQTQNPKPTYTHIPNLCQVKKNQVFPSFHLKIIRRSSTAFSSYIYRGFSEEAASCWGMPRASRPARSRGVSVMGLAPTGILPTPSCHRSPHAPLFCQHGRGWDAEGRGELWEGQHSVHCHCLKSALTHPSLLQGAYRFGFSVDASSFYPRIR